MRGRHVQLATAVNVTRNQSESAAVPTRLAVRVAVPIEASVPRSVAAPQVSPWLSARHSQPSENCRLRSKYPELQVVTRQLLVMQLTPVAFGCGAVVQFVAQLPQWVTSVVVLVSQPFASLLSQLAYPEKHDAIAQLPVEQLAVAFAREHDMPQAAQCESVLSCCSHPLAAAPSQSPYPELQAVI